MLFYSVHESKSSLTGWRRRHCFCCSARGYISPISVYNLPRLRTSNVDRSNERKWLYVKKAKSRQYPVQTITDADNADDIALLPNTPAQAESLLHSLEQAAGGTVLHLNADKTKYMCFNKKGDFTLNGGSLKRVDKFIYLGSNVSSTENDTNERLAKAWKAIDRL